jgi:WD40-like Beta Propeller Repeat
MLHPLEPRTRDQKRRPPEGRARPCTGRSSTLILIGLLGVGPLAPGGHQADSLKKSEPIGRNGRANGDQSAQAPGSRVRAHCGRVLPCPIDLGVSLTHFSNATVCHRRGTDRFQQQPGRNPEIYVMDADGTGIERLTDDPGLDDGAAWSPDGTRIAFASDRDGDFDLYVMNTDGTSVTHVTDDPRDDDWPAWSPDGAALAFGSDRDGNLEIYVIGADGTGERRLTDNPGKDGDPVWARTG